MINNQSVWGKTPAYIILLLLMVCPAWAELDESQLGLLNSQASSFFREANKLLKTDRAGAYALYDKCILRYQKMIDEGRVKNVYLYYNMGNAYLMQQDIGRAILNYRRGERLGPGYTDLIKNLNHARMQRKDRIVASTEKKILHTLFFWHYDLSGETKFLLMTFMWVCFCLLLTLSFWKGRMRWLRLILSLFVFAIVSISISLAINVIRDKHDIPGVILDDSVVVRQGDGENYPASFEQPLHSGTEFTLIEQRPDWLHIEMANGDDAWIHRSHVGLID